MFTVSVTYFESAHPKLVKLKPWFCNFLESFHHLKKASHEYPGCDVVGDACVNAIKTSLAESNGVFVSNSNTIEFASKDDANAFISKWS